MKVIRKNAPGIGLCAQFRGSARRPVSVLSGPRAPAVTAARPSAATTESEEFTITSDPDAAEIDIDGRFHGNTPATLKLPAGPQIAGPSGFRALPRDTEIVETQAEGGLRASSGTVSFPSLVFRRATPCLDNRIRNVYKVTDSRFQAECLSAKSRHSRGPSCLSHLVACRFAVARLTSPRGSEGGYATILENHLAVLRRDSSRRQ
jgi:hypothetical protein